MLTGVALCRPVSVLEVRGESTGRLWLRPVAGEAVVVSYVHSVERDPVSEWLTFDGRGLVVTATEFSSGGAGLPASEPGLQIRDGRLAVTLNRPLGVLTLATRPETRHRLEFRGRVFELSLPAETARVRIAVRVLPWLVATLNEWRP
jgi:hypothetical protein